jgi:hypothetical protein
MTDKRWSFIHNLASEAKWTPGVREIFEYRDLGIKDGTNGDYVAHLIRRNGRKTIDEVTTVACARLRVPVRLCPQRLGNLRVRGPGPTHDPHRRLHPADAWYQAS